MLDRYTLHDYGRKGNMNSCKKFVWHNENSAFRDFFWPYSNEDFFFVIALYNNVHVIPPNVYYAHV